ncbi:MAG: SDR family oxidoreductase, partial [Planctomycetota bacterium]
MSDFLQLENRNIVVFGAANRKSVAWLTACTLEDAGANVIHVVRNETRKTEVEKLVARRGKESPVYFCDVERQEHIDEVAEAVG